MAAGGLHVNFPDGVPAATNHEAAGRLGPSSMFMPPVHLAPVQPAGNGIVNHQATRRHDASANWLGLVYRHAWSNRMPSKTPADLRQPPLIGTREPGVRSGAEPLRRAGRQRVRHGRNAASRDRPGRGTKLRNPGRICEHRSPPLPPFAGRPVSAESPAGVSRQHSRGRCRD
jgi:hypothetical protein